MNGSRGAEPYSLLATACSSTVVSSGATESQKSGARADYLLNFIVGSIWLYYAWSRFQLWRDSHTPLLLMALIRNTAITLLFFCRRPSKMTSRSVKEWAVALLATFIGYFYEPGTSVLPNLHAAFVYLAGTLGVVSLLTLGRSFGIVPANRGIVTTGPYAVVRHPIYASYILLDIGLLLGAFALRNVVVFLGFVAAVYLRATYEERLLGNDQAYSDYVRRTRYMFIPGVL